MRSVPADGGRGFTGLSHVLVANSSAHQDYPIEHGNEAVGNRAKRDNVQGPHAAFEQRKMHFRHKIRHGQERPGHQACNEKSSRLMTEAEYGNPEEQDQDRARHEVA